MPLVLTQPDRPAGRGRRLTASPVKELAVELDLPVGPARHPARADPDTEPPRAARPHGRHRLWVAAPAGAARVAAARLRQPARVAAAALARRGADPTRRAGRRHRDRHQRHADGCRARHGTRAPRAVDADRRRTKRPVRSTNGSPLVAAEALLAALPSILAGTSVAVPQQQRARDRRPEDRENRSAARLARASRRCSSGACARSTPGPLPKRS